MNNNNGGIAVLDTQTSADGGGDKPPTTVLAVGSEPSGQAPAPEKVEVKPRIPAIAPEFWKAYNTVGGVEKLQGYRPRSIVTLGRMTEVAEALGRSLTVEDFEKFVVLDGDRRNCDLCGTEFQPVKWVILTRDFLAQIRDEGLESALANEKTVWGGCFMNIGFTIKCVCCGTGPYYYGQKPGNGGEFAVMNKFVCLGKAWGSEQNVNPKTKKPNPVRDHAGAIRVQEILKKGLQEKVQRSHADEESIGGFFDGAHQDTRRAVKQAWLPSGDNKRGDRARGWRR